HERAHNMQTVQFSSLSAITPRARVGGSSRSCGYCTVTAGFSMVFNVTPRPVTTPGTLGFLIGSPSSERNLERGRGDDVEQGDRDQELPRQRLELVFAQSRIGEAHPEHQEGDEHDL